SRSRRDFIRQTAALMAGGILTAGIEFASALPNGQPFGFQTFEIFPNLKADWQGTWNAMAVMGYKFADLDYWGVIGERSAVDIKQSLAKAGLSCTNCLFLFDAMNEQSFNKSMEVAHVVGATSVTIVSGGDRTTLRDGHKPTPDDWKWLG